MKKRWTLLALATLLLLVGCAENFSEKKSQSVAEDFIKNAPTYAFDGQDLKLINSEKLRCEQCFLFSYEFNTTHAGYGNRSGQMLAQVMTPHHASVVVKKGEVVQAIIDNEWDELNQGNLKTSESQEVYYCPTSPSQDCKAEQKTVCGSQGKEYRNACEACSKRNVKWYIEGKCEGNYQKVIEDLSRGKITKKNAPVLVLVAWELE